MIFEAMGFLILALLGALLGLLYPNTEKGGKFASPPPLTEEEKKKFWKNLVAVLPRFLEKKNDDEFLELFCKNFDIRLVPLMQKEATDSELDRAVQVEAEVPEIPGLNRRFPMDLPLLPPRD